MTFLGVTFEEWNILKISTCLKHNQVYYYLMVGIEAKSEKNEGKTVLKNETI